jgi:hypothetical protein
MANNNQSECNNELIRGLLSSKTPLDEPGHGHGFKHSL